MVKDERKEMILITPHLPLFIPCLVSWRWTKWCASGVVIYASNNGNRLNH